MRTFTDIKGRTIEAELIETSDTTVRIRRDDGRSFEIDKDTLSEADQDYIKAWELKRAFAFGGVEVSAYRVRLDTDRSQTRTTYKKEETWCYKFTIANNSRARLEGLSAEWRLYFLDDVLHAKKRDLEIKRKQGRVAVGTLEAGAERQLRTSPVELRITQLRPGWHYRDTNKRRVEDSLVGIWIRVMRGQEIVVEFADPTTLAKDQAW